MIKIPLKHANIIQILGIETLPLDERKAIVEEAVNLVEMESFNRVMERLEGSEEIEKFMEALEKKDDDTLVEVFEKAGIDLVEIMEAETEKVKQEMIKISKL